jgi:hypothetical protein
MKLVSVSAMVGHICKGKPRDEIYAVAKDGSLWVGRYAHIDDNPDNKFELRWVSLPTPQVERADSCGENNSQMDAVSALRDIVKKIGCCRKNSKGNMSALELQVEFVAKEALKQHH